MERIGGKAVMAGLMLAAAGALGAAVRSIADEPAALPGDYRSWSHVKSMVIFEGHPLAGSFGGIHHIYANDIAARTYQSGKDKPFPDGSVIIFDLLHAQSGDDTLTEGARKLVGMMVKDGARYPDTGGWGYFAFGPDGAPLAIDPAGCHACHEDAAGTDHVFSSWRK